MSNQQQLMEEALSVAKDAHVFSRFYQTLTRLETLVNSLAEQIVTTRKAYDSAQKKGDKKGSTVLATELLKMQMSLYGLVKQKVEVVKQFNDMVAINKDKLTAALEHLGKGNPKTATSKIISMHEQKQRSRRQKKRRCFSSQTIQSQEQTSLDSFETPKSGSNLLDF